MEPPSEQGILDDREKAPRRILGPIDRDLAVVFPNDRLSEGPGFVPCAVVVDLLDLVTGGSERSHIGFAVACEILDRIVEDIKIVRITRPLLGTVQHQSAREVIGFGSVRPDDLQHPDLEGC
jgi:hypothetical protein